MTEYEDYKLTIDDIKRASAKENGAASRDAAVVTGLRLLADILVELRSLHETIDVKAQRIEQVLQQIQRSTLKH